jgi:hypothetical protein
MMVEELLMLLFNDVFVISGEFLAVVQRILIEIALQIHIVVIFIMTLEFQTWLHNVHKIVYVTLQIHSFILLIAE